MTDVRTKFSQRLKFLRKKMGYSIPGFAKRSGISRQHIRELEQLETRKRVTIVTLNKIAKAFSMTLSKLLDFDG